MVTVVSGNWPAWVSSWRSEGFDVMVVIQQAGETDSAFADRLSLALETRLATAERFRCLVVLHEEAQPNAGSAGGPGERGRELTYRVQHSR